MSPNIKVTNKNKKQVIPRKQQTCYPLKTGTLIHLVTGVQPMCQAESSYEYPTYDYKRSKQRFNKSSTNLL